MLLDDYVTYLGPCVLQIPVFEIDTDTWHHYSCMPDTVHGTAFLHLHLIHMFKVQWKTFKSSMYFQQY